MVDAPQPLHTSVSSSQVILGTKLFVPTLRRGLVERRRLRDRLNQGLTSRLVLVSAPAGYGKTTLIADWLNHTYLPAIWLSLDEGDNDPVRFFSYLIATLRKVDEAIGGATSSLLSLPSLPPVEALVTPLVNDIASAETVFALVLDEYHVVHEPLIHEAMEFLIGHQPPLMHLIILTRRDPPLPLARLRASGEVTEVRAHDLRFTEAEAAEFLRKTTGLALDEKAIGTLSARTEGWAAGLQLAALSLQGRDDVDAFLSDFGGSDRYVIDYLLEEVLRHLPGELQTFLHETAILSRLCAPLCAAVTGRDDSKALLVQLEQSNLFLVPLDSNREWYRYHHLFADVLRSGLDSEHKAALHKRASHWLESHGLLPEAVGHALASGDTAHAGRLVGRAVAGAFRQGELVTLLGWMEALPTEVFQNDIELASYRALILLVLRRDAAVTAVADLQSSLPVQADPLARGRVLALQAWLAGNREDPQTVPLAQEALDLIGDADPTFRIMTLLRLGIAQHQRGQTSAATRTFRQAYQLEEESGRPFITLGALTNLAANLNRQGARREAEALCLRAVERYVDGRGRPLPITGMAYIPLGLVCYEADELDRAREYLLRGIELCRQASLDKQMLGDGEWGLARLQFATGEVEAALRTVREAREAAERTGPLRIVRLMAAFEAELELRSGRVSAAVRWAEASGLWPAEAIDTSVEVAYFVMVRVLLATDQVDEARDLLASLERAAREGGRDGRLINIHILQALSERALGREDEVRDYLGHALRLAAPEGYRRAFLDEGPAVADLLAGVREVAPTFVDELLESFQAISREPAAISYQSSAISQEGPGLRTPTHHSSPITHHSLVEPLSEREMEILQLIAAGQSNAQIAEALVITVGTAKWHAYNIYGKLGVQSRTQAVARAQELGLL